MTASQYQLNLPIHIHQQKVNFCQHNGFIVSSADANDVAGSKVPDIF